MEDQGKSLMLAVAIAFGIMLLWTTLIDPPKEEVRPEEVATEPAGDRAAGETPPETDQPATDAAPEAPELVRGEEELFVFEFDNLRVEFSSYGAALKSWKLLGPRLQDREKNEPQDLVLLSGEDHQFLRVWFEDSTFDIPAGAEWKGEKRSNNQMRFTWESDDIRVVKDITLHPESFTAMMDVSVELVGVARAKQALAVSMYSQQDPTVESGGLFSQVERVWKAACFYDEEIRRTSTKSLSKSGGKKRIGAIDWGGFDHAYFLSALSFEGKQGGHQRMACNAYPVDDVVGGMRLDMVQMSTELKKGEPGLRSTMVLYLGPKYQDTLESISELAGFETEFEESIDLGFLGIIAGPLLSLLNFFQTFVINWGLAIVLLTFVVKGLTLPWTHKSMKSMKAMARLKPQLEKIKEKHKDDRVKQNQETMNLFKSHKVNPMSGCLPMLLQMPIWFALYRALTVAGELYQAPFIPGWIDDLTLPDPFYIMPILLTGMMFLQTRLTPSTGTGAQQKMLMYGMPIMFGAFSFVFPAGLTLYIFTNTCFTAVHHLYMHKTDPVPDPVKAAIAESGVLDVEATEASKDSEKKSSASTKSKKKSGGKGKKKKR